MNPVVEEMEQLHRCYLAEVHALDRAIELARGVAERLGRLVLPEESGPDHVVRDCAG